MNNTTSTASSMASKPRNRRFFDLISRLFAPLLILTVGFLLYRPALDLMLFWDDIPHMLWLDTHRGGGYWVSSSGFPFYRPAAFAVWEFLYEIFGRHDAPALHALSIFLHLANSILVYAIATRLSQKRLTGLFAGLIFLTFPFSYQTVIPTPAQFHLWLTFGFLASAYLILLWLDDSQAWKLVAAWVIAFWAIFSHENGIVAPVLIGIILLTAHFTDLALRRKIMVALGPIAVFAIFYGLVWRLVPIANDSTGLKFADLDAKIGQTLQAIGFPLAAQFRRFLGPVDGTTLAWVSGISALVVFGLWFYGQYRWRPELDLELDEPDGEISQSGHTRLTALGLIWIPLAMLPAWLFLDAGYLLSNPRLHYLASVGIAWAWAALLTIPLPRFAPAPLQWVIGGTGLIIFLLVGVPFIRERLDEHHTLNDYYAEIAETTEGQEVLLVNPPAYLAPRTPSFLLGAEGSVYLPDFVNLNDFLRLNEPDLSADTHVTVARADDLMPATTTIYQVEAIALDRTTIANYETVLVARRIGETLLAVPAGEHLENNAVIDTPAADFGNGVVLESLKIGPDEDLRAASGENGFRLELVWQLQRTPTEPIEIFVHLMCGGRLATDADGPPLSRLYPFAMWRAGEHWRDYRYFIIPEGMYPPECLSVLVGLYNPTTEERLPVTATIPFE